MSIHADQSHLLDTRAAAEYLGLSPHTLNNWRAHGKGPAVTKLEGACRYSRHALDEYIRENTHSKNDAGLHQ